MRRIMSILAVVGLVLGASIAVSAPADAAIRANDDEFLVQKLGNRLRVVLNNNVLFKKIKISDLGGGQKGWRFTVNANDFLANDIGKKKAMVAFGALSKINGVSLNVETKKNGVVKQIVFTVRAKVFKNPGRRLLTDYVLRANDPQYDAGIVFMRVASPT